MELLLLIVATLVVFYECFKLINMSDFVEFADNLKKYKGNDARLMRFIGSRNVYIFLLISEYIYIAIFIYLFFTALYPVAVYMLISAIVLTILDKVKGSVNTSYRYADSVLTIMWVILTYVLLIGGNA